MISKEVKKLQLTRAIVCLFYKDLLNKLDL